MKLITNVCMITGIFIGIPLIFYVIFHGTYMVHSPDLSRYESGYTVQRGRDYDLEEYILHVLPGEVEKDTEYDAVKAQAVIIRTNILRQMDKKHKIKGKELEEYFWSDEKLKEQLGSKEYHRRKQVFTRAIMETVGVVMCYKDKYIMPLYHKVSVGMTLSANEFYGSNIPYLQSVDSNKDVESKDYMSVQEWDYEDMVAKIAQDKKDRKVTAKDLQEHLLITNKTKSGYVKSMEVGTYKFTGQEWSDLFDLPSANFYIEDYNGKMRIVTLGQGHGMGLSQYGADQLAKEGKSYRYILKHYYKNIDIIKHEKK